MPQFTCPVVRIEKIEKHPNADTLSLTEVEGCPVIFRTGDFKEGDLGIYIPVESLVPEDRDWVKKNCSHLKFKNGVHRVKAVRLRGIFSMGLLLPLHTSAPVFTIGDDLAEALGIKKYEEPDDQNFEQKNTPRKPVTFWDHLKYAFYKLFRISNKKRKITRPMPIYDLENYRKNKEVLQLGEEVVCTEKTHGCSSAFGYHKKRFWVSSHRVLRPAEDNSFWWRAVRKYDLENKLKAYPDLIFYGEVFGEEIQDMHYGVQTGHVNIVFFDIYNVKTNKYLDYGEFRTICYNTALPMAPILYEGPYDPAIIDSLKDGPSVLGTALGLAENHPLNFREGVVIKPAVERLDRRVGRVALKLVGEKYLLRKNPTERH
jgi:hypothetical protein